MKIFTKELWKFLDTVPPKQKEYYKIYLTLIISGMIQASKQEYIKNDYFIPIAFDTFLKKGIPNHQIKSLQRTLEEAKIISVNHSYLSINSRSEFAKKKEQKDTYPKGYRIMTEYLQTPIMIEAKKYKDEVDSKATLPKLKSYFISLNMMKLSKPIDEIYAIECNSNILGEVNDYYMLRKNLHLYYNLWQFENVKTFNRCEAGRLHNRLTRLMKKLRKYIKGFDHKVMLDISNCQMFLLACLMKKNNITDSYYTELVCSGKFKEYILKQYQESDKYNYYTMAEVKSDINTYFFGQTQTHTYCKQIMKEQFPKAHNYLMIMKAEDYTASSFELQKAEAKMMIQNVYNSLRKEGIKPYFIHDAIMVNEVDEYKTIEIISFEFAIEYGIEPNLKKERFS